MFEKCKCCNKRFGHDICCPHNEHGHKLEPMYMDSLITGIPVKIGYKCKLCSYESKNSLAWSQQLKVINMIKSGEDVYDLYNNKIILL